MNSGSLNQLINIRSYTANSRSTDGQVINTVTTVLADIWCNVRPISAREFARMDNRYAEADTLFTLRYTSVITETMRVILGSDEYDIKGPPIDVDYKHEELQIAGRKII